MIKILAIDDILDNLIVLNAMMKKLLPECKVLTALSGAEGIEMANTENPDTILLDLQMPGIDGFEVCENLKNSDTTKHIPIIILTALHKDTESKIRALEKGADAFLSKPIDKGELLAQINAMLRIRRAEDLLRDENRRLEALVEKRTEELTASEKKYRNFFEDDLTADFISTPEGNLLDCNKAFVELFGFENKEAALNLKVAQVYPDIEIRKEFLEDLRLHKMLINYQIIMQTVDGELLRVQENARGIFDKNNQLIEIRGYISDITEKYKAEQALLKENEINHTIAQIGKEILSNSLSIDKVANMIYSPILKLSDSPEGFISLINNRTEKSKMCCKSKLFDKFEGLPVIKTKNDSYYMGLVGKCMNTKSSFYTNNTSEYDEDDTFGKRLYRFLAVPVYGNNTLFGQLAVANAERNYTDNDLKILQRFANIFVLAIIRKQTDKELIDAKRKAEESDRLKSSFLANLSHEIRTPLNGIMGFSQLLQRPDLNTKKVHQYSGVIIESSNKLLEIISDILDISLIDTGMIKINKTRFNLNEFMMAVYKLNEKQFEEKENVEVELTLAQANENYYIYTDENRLRQIFKNLLSNALKFTEKGTVEIGYSIEENGELIFFVKDTGIGISEAKQNIVFERFRQEDESHTRQYGGTGIGLTIAKGLVEMFNGRMWLNSEKGKGAEFYFSLPAEIVESPTYTIENKSIDGINIMVVDDTLDICEYLGEVLTDEGANTYFAHNGKEAINKLHEIENLDAILMDIQMPIMNGYEATEIIRKQNKNVVIIAQTAYGLTTEADDLYQKGFNDFIPKPIDSESLIKVLLKNLK